MKYFIAFFGAAVMFAPSAGAAYAADGPTAAHTATAAQDSCAISAADIDAINAAQTQGFSAELAARKALLARTISCAKREAIALKTSLGGLAAQDDAGMIQSQLSSRLDDAANYYDLELAKVDGAGLAATKAIAREVRDWRTANYASLAGQVANFTLWTQNQNLFAVAGNRSREMRSAAGFISQVAPNADLQTAMASAEALVAKATDENDQAKQALRQGLPPEGSLTLIMQSLTSLADAYRQFAAAGAIIQTLLPTGDNR